MSYTIDQNRITLGCFRFTVLSSSCIRFERRPVEEKKKEEQSKAIEEKGKQSTQEGKEEKEQKGKEATQEGKEYNKKEEKTEEIKASEREEREQGKFEDRASQVFLFRNNVFKNFSINTDGYESGEDEKGGKKEGGKETERKEKEGPEKLQINTDNLMIQFVYDGNQFSMDNLVVEDTFYNKFKWRYQEKVQESENLLGTTRTLDYQRVKGKPIIEEGLLDKCGFTIIDDSHSLVFNEKQWLIPRGGAPTTVAQIGLKPNIPSEPQDFYFFAYGPRYQQCLKDFADLAGPVPLVPKWALGLWWSKWHPYTQQELIDLVDTFQLKKIPLSALCIDMDWHLVDVQDKPGGSSGWTGYTWNTQLFPDPKKLLDDLHQRGVRVSLNLHPSDGCYPHEAAYKAFAEFMNINPDDNKLICFNIGDPKFAEGYFRFLHHPHEEIGVDMWWIDWQQEDTTSIPSLTPIWWLNHLHHANMLNKEVRSLTFSRWGGLGSHRYPLGFSGDTVVDWTSLQMLPYITATAANVCYNWWSHDIGGFMWGTNNPDLYIRWFQFGALSPILRLHSTKNIFEEKLPWKYDKGTFEIIKDAIKLRESLIPYIYSISWKMYSQKDTSLLFPTYYVSPDSPQAYACPYQYFFGSELLVVPFLSPVDPDTRLSRAVAWFSGVSWFDIETGEEYKGGKYHVLYGKIDKIPIFAPSGAIVPLALRKLPPKAQILNMAQQISVDSCDIYEMRVFCGGKFSGTHREFLLYDDNGESMEYQTAIPNVTKLINEKSEPNLNSKTIGRQKFTIEPPTSTNIKHRVYRVKIMGIPSSAPELLKVTCTVNNEIVPINFQYSPGSFQVCFQPVYSDLTAPITFLVDYELENAAQNDTRMTQQKNSQLIDMISSFNTFAPIKVQISDNIPKPSLDWIFTSGFDTKTSMYKAHIESTAECGSACFETPESTFVVLWNYNQLDQAQFEYVSSTNPKEEGILPRERIINFSREFKQKHNSTITVTYGGKWRDTYTIGVFTPVAKKPEKKKSFIQQIKKMFGRT